MRHKMLRLTVVWVLALVLLSSWGPQIQAQEPDVDVLKEIIGLIERHYLRDADGDELFKSAIEGMLRSLGDPYASYMDKEAYDRYMEGLEGSFGGIGVTIEVKDGYVTVVSVFEGGPAHGAGLEPGDRILEADGQNLKGMSLSDAARVIRGDEGTSVTLKIHKKTADEIVVLKVIRESIVIPTVEWRMLEDRIGYIRITSFRDNTSVEVYKALMSMREEGMKVLAVDLRNNAGGLLTESVRVAEVLVPNGAVVHVVRRDGIRQTIKASNTPAIPITVLVNGGTASGAEIVAGAIRDRGTGVLVGTRTFGKGTVQSLITLESGGGLKLTTAEYLMPSGESIEGKGIEPNFHVDRGRMPVILRTLDGPDLGYGARGAAVEALQEDLRDLGYNPGPADGVFGPMTRSALVALQRDAGVTATGVLDAATKDALKGMAEAKGLEDPQMEKALEILREFLP